MGGFDLGIALSWLQYPLAMIEFLNEIGSEGAAFAACLSLPILLTFLIYRRSQLLFSPPIELRPTLPHHVGLQWFCMPFFGLLVPALFFLLVRRSPVWGDWYFGTGTNTGWTILAGLVAIWWLTGRLAESALRLERPYFGGWLDRIVASLALLLLLRFHILAGIAGRDAVWLDQKIVSPFVLIFYHIAMPQVLFAGATLVYGTIAWEVWREPTSARRAGGWRRTSAWILASLLWLLPVMALAIHLPRMSHGQALAVVEANRDDIAEIAAAAELDPSLLAGIVYVGQRGRARWTGPLLDRQILNREKPDTRVRTPCPNCGGYHDGSSDEALWQDLPVGPARLSLERTGALIYTIEFCGLDEDWWIRRQRSQAVAGMDEDTKIAAYLVRRMVAAREKHRRKLLAIDKADDFSDYKDVRTLTYIPFWYLSESFLASTIRSWWTPEPWQLPEPLIEKINSIEFVTAARARFDSQTDQIKKQTLAMLYPSLIASLGINYWPTDHLMDTYSRWEQLTVNCKLISNYKSMFIVRVGLLWEELNQNPAQLLDERVNLILAATLIRFLGEEWRTAKFPVDDRPEILATLYYYSSPPHHNPVPNAFGRAVLEFMQSEDARRLFPAAEVIAPAAAPPAD